jgi:serine/threonine protein kinase
MGTVYQALDRKTGNLIALKILHSRNTIEQARFDQEARVLAELSHPGIVRYFDHGVTPNGSPYIAMEWLDGETLEDRLGRGNLGPVAAAHVARLVLEALSAAHSCNVVHRDIKPGNIFLVGWKLSEIRVLDFGIARRVLDTKRLTRKGSTVGTPLYTSPEQARGRADVDGRSDIFSLGCVLFEVLTGEPPFTGETPLEVMTKVCAGRVPEIASKRAGLPPSLTSLVHTMLAPDPAARPSSAAQLAQSFAGVVQELGGIEAEFAATAPPVQNKRASIGENEEHLASALLISLGWSSPTSSERRFGPKPSSVTGTSMATASAFAAPARNGKDSDDLRLAEIRRVLELYACEVDRLIDRTLLVTAPMVSTAHEQVIQLASAALALRKLEPDAKIAFATGRASFIGRLPVGSLMDRLPTMLEGQDHRAIRIDETTYRLLANRFVTRGWENLRELVGEAPILASFDVPATPDAGAFLGREREMATLQAVVDEVRDERIARPVLLLGPPGIGKSRLLREFLASLPGAKPGVLVTAGTLLRVERRFPALVPVLAAAGIDMQGKSTTQVELELSAWIDRHCTSVGFFLIFEDLQWADSPSLDLLDRVLHRLHDRPLIVVGLGRDEVEDRFPGLWSARSVQRLPLRPLPSKRGIAMLRAVLPTISRADMDFVLDRWEGNPRFLEEMAAAARPGTMSVPDVVYAVAEGRLEGVEPDVRRVLRAASLFGEKTFTVESLIALLGESSRKGIAEWLEVLVMRGLIEFELRAGEANYRFRERLMRDAAYQMLTSTDRLVGRRLARTWLQRAGRTLPEFLAQLGTGSRLSATGSG